ncbi:MAG: PepSY domain-containing protein [Lachnospiraceae bacterium]|nr:PepSY domain-containing protein [Lachnospiraceae bacterium]
MKAKKFLFIAACSLSALFAGCGTRDDVAGSPSPTTGIATPDSTSPSAASDTDTGTSISMDLATKLAFEDAKVSEDELDNMRTRLEEGENGKQYFVTFATSQKAYQYHIDASDGTILEKNVNSLSAGSATIEGTTILSEVTTTPEATPAPEATTKPAATSAPKATSTPLPTKPASTPKPTSASSSQTGEISQDRALEIAKKDAGVSDSQIFNLEIKLDYENGIKVYEIEFDTAKMEYEYDIAVSDGRIVDKKSEMQDHVSTTAKPTKTPSSQSGDITQDKALEIAKKDAGVSDSQIFNLEIKLDYDNGIKVYEIEFDTIEMEYEYDIAVSDGRIVDKKSEMQDPVSTAAGPTKTPSSQSGDITQDKALEIAKKDAGVSDSQIFNLEIKLDYDDGIKVYEIEFDTTEMEYEYDITVSDGRIVDKKSEMQDHITTKTPSSETDKITKDQAIKIARKDAGVSTGTIYELEIKLDYDDGIRIYEIEFCDGTYEYEYEIGASDGTILKKEYDTCDKGHHSTNK